MSIKDNNGPSKAEEPIKQFIGRSWSQKGWFAFQVLVYFATAGLVFTNVIDTTDRDMGSV